MHNIDFPTNTWWGAICGFIAVILKTMFFKELVIINGMQTVSILSFQSIMEAFVVGGVGSLAGILMSGLVKWIKAKWLGITKKK